MSRRLAALVVFAAIALAGCGDPEATQRKSFISFLQTRIIDKPGLHVPQLTPDEAKSFGAYGAHYAVITEFHRVMNESVSPKLTAALSQGAVSSVGDLVRLQPTLQAARTIMSQMVAALDDDLARADASHAALTQTADVKAVYDSAYERLVSVPGATLRSVAPVADQAFADALDLATYLDQHKGQVTVSGAMLQASSAPVRDAVNAKLQKLQASQQAIQRAQSTFQTMVYGTRN